jgi:hypothetical protein
MNFYQALQYMHWLSRYQAFIMVWQGQGNGAGCCQKLYRIAKIIYTICHNWLQNLEVKSDTDMTANCIFLLFTFFFHQY